MDFSEPKFIEYLHAAPNLQVLVVLPLHLLNPFPPKAVLINLVILVLLDDDGPLLMDYPDKLLLTQVLSTLVALVEVGVAEVSLNQKV